MRKSRENGQRTVSPENSPFCFQFVLFTYLVSNNCSLLLFSQLPAEPVHHLILCRQVDLWPEQRRPRPLLPLHDKRYTSDLCLIFVSEQEVTVSC